MRDEKTQKYIEWYLRAYRDKSDRNIFDNIKLYDKYWRGEVNCPECDYDPGSNVNVIHPIIEGQVAMLIEQNIAVSVRPVTPDDLPFAERTRRALEFVKERNQLMRVLDIHERRREKYGVGVLRVTYDPKAFGGVGLPLIECVANQDIFVDPCVTDPLKLNQAEYVIETVTKSIYWARQMYGEQLATEIKPNYFPESGGDVFEEQDRTGDNDKYLHMLVWTLDGGQLRLVEMSGCGTILKDHDVIYGCGTYPYFFTPLYPREGSIWGMGDVELLVPLQDLINDLDDQTRISARLTGNPQRLIETGSGIDLDSLTNEAGLNIPVNNVNSVRNLQPPTFPEYITRRRELALKYEVQKVSRFSDQMIGNKQQGVDTATETLALQQSGAQGVNYKKMLLQETLSEVFSYCLKLIRQFWNDEVYLRVDDKEDEFMSFSGRELTDIPKYEYTGKPDPKQNGRAKARKIGKKDAEFDVYITVGAGMPTNKAFQYTMMLELSKGGVLTVDELRQWLVDNFGLSIPPEHPEKILRETQREMAMQQMQAAGQPQQQAEPPQMPPQQAQGVVEGVNAAGNVQRPMPNMGGMP